MKAAAAKKAHAEKIADAEKRAQAQLALANQQAKQDKTDQAERAKVLRSLAAQRSKAEATEAAQRGKEEAKRKRDAEALEKKLTTERNAAEKKATRLVDKSLATLASKSEIQETFDHFLEANDIWYVLAHSRCACSGTNIKKQQSVSCQQVCTSISIVYQQTPCIAHTDMHGPVHVCSCLQGHSQPFRARAHHCQKSHRW